MPAELSLTQVYTEESGQRLIAFFNNADFGHHRQLLESVIRVDHVRIDLFFENVGLYSLFEPEYV